MGWSREKAINYLKENSGLSESFIEAEIDRYIVWPGQALAYKIGELKIKELRAKAENALGPKFDIRKFHNALIDDGPLPLDVLEQRIDEWIKGARIPTLEVQSPKLDVEGAEAAMRGLAGIRMLGLLHGPQ